MTQEFFINNRFLVNPDLNRVRDMVGEVDTHLEPRIMELLIILCENSGKPVAREKLVSQIWKDYGGADEGLTQAISFLRKILDDFSKQIIKTIPKKGYILQADITESNQLGNGKDKTDFAPNNRVYAYRFSVIGLIAIVIVATILYAFYFRSNRVPKQPVTEVAFPRSEREENNNPLTTITTTDSLGNHYRLVMIGDRRPKFYVNDSLQLNQEPYDVLIDKLAKELWQRQKDAEGQ